MLALAPNESFVLLQRQYPGITDFYLSPEGWRSIWKY